MKLVGRRKKSYDADSLSAAAVSELNRRDLNIFGEYVWNHADTERVILQLMGEKKLKTCGWPWRGKITLCRDGFLQNKRSRSTAGGTS